MFKLFYAFLFSYQICAEKVHRIQEMDQNVGRAEAIYLAPGLVTVLELPCFIEEYNTGIDPSIRVELSDKNPSRLAITATNEAKPNSLIVHCKEYSFVYDLVINKINHQSLVKIISPYGSPYLKIKSKSPLKPKLIELKKQKYPVIVLDKIKVKSEVN